LLIVAVGGRVVGKKLPKTAVKPLLQHCVELSKESGKPAKQIFKEILELMEKHKDYFFNKRWPETRKNQLERCEENSAFIEAGKNMEDRLERFTLFCFKRNISMEGFDVDRFKGDYESYGGRECYRCSVPEAMKLRKDTELLKSQWKETWEDMKREKPSWLSIRMAENNKKPEVIRQHKTYFVKLRLYEDEEIGGAKGKSCDVRNKYKCPYGELSEDLIEYGHIVELMIKAMEWYDENQKSGFHDDFFSGDGKFDYESISVDLASLHDVREAVSDRRMSKLVNKYIEYMKMRYPGDYA